MKKLEKDDKKEIFRYGTGMGCLFFISNMIYLGLQKDQNFILKIMPWMGGILAGYLVFGLLFFFFYMKLSGRDFSLLKSFTKGIAGIYSLGNLMPLVFLAGIFLSDKKPVRIMLLLDLLIIIGFYVLDYRSVWNLSKQLNGKAYRTKTLLIDLDECPKSPEEFCRSIEKYCNENHISLEFLHRGVPALILMDGKECTVELESYYSRFGPVYGMKFIEQR